MKQVPEATLTRITELLRTLNSGAFTVKPGAFTDLVAELDAIQKAKTITSQELTQIVNASIPTAINKWDADQTLPDGSFYQNAVTNNGVRYERVGNSSTWRFTA